MINCIKCGAILHGKDICHNCNLSIDDFEEVSAITIDDLIAHLTKLRSLYPSLTSAAIKINGRWDSSYSSNSTVRTIYTVVQDSDSSPVIVLSSGSPHN